MRQVKGKVWERARYYCEKKKHDEQSRWERNFFFSGQVKKKSRDHSIEEGKRIIRHYFKRKSHTINKQIILSL